MNTDRSSDFFDPALGDRPLSREEILTHLDTERIGRSLVLLEEIDSTNSYLAREMKGLPDGTVASAEYQTGGRGRHGRVWVSPPRKNLMFSLLLRSPSPPPRVATLVGALAIVREVNRTKPFLALKWPNDVVTHPSNDDDRERKIGGVLCETKTDPSGDPVLILGIGINLNTTPKEWPDELNTRATSLRELSGGNWDRNRLLAGILNSIESLVRADTDSIIREARRICSTLGNRVRIQIGNNHLHGEAMDLDTAGRLLLKDDRGEIHPVELGEVNQIRKIV